MRRGDALRTLTFLAGAALACRHAAPGAADPRSAAPPAEARAPAAAPSAAEVQEINDRFAREIAERIAGREGEPAENVFENVQWLKGVAAERFLRIMNRGYSRALGVACTHCHVEGDFASDEKRPKRAAREMAAMHRSINERLREMKNLDSESDRRAINCSTCHRGSVDPATADR